MKLKEVAHGLLLVLILAVVVVVLLLVSSLHDALTPKVHAAPPTRSQTELLRDLLGEFTSTAADTTVAHDTTAVSLPRPSGCDLIDSIAVLDTTAIDSFHVTTDTALVDTVVLAADTTYALCWDSKDSLVALEDTASRDTTAFTEAMPTCCDTLDTLVVVEDSFWVCIDTARSDTLPLAQAETLTCAYDLVNDTLVVRTDTAYVDTLPWHWAVYMGVSPYCADVLETLVVYTVETDSYYVCTETTVVEAEVGVMDSVLAMLKGQFLGYPHWYQAELSDGTADSLTITPGFRASRLLVVSANLTNTQVPFLLRTFLDGDSTEAWFPAEALAAGVMGAMVPSSVIPVQLDSCRVYLRAENGRWAWWFFGE